MRLLIVVMIVALGLFVVSNLSVEGGVKRTVGKIEMVNVPGGTYVVGSTEQQVSLAVSLCQTYGTGCTVLWFLDEQPQRQVVLDEFWIDKYEVTTEEYGECVDAGRCVEPDSAADCNWNRADRGNHPVNCIDWYQAKTYCEYKGKRLPTELEWEVAARGQDGRIFPWGDRWDPHMVNYCDKSCLDDMRDPQNDDGYGTTAPVGAFADNVSPFGAYDMAGNVWEWTSDYYDSSFYEDMPEQNPTNTTLDVYHSIRGGGWDYWPAAQRTSNREWDEPSLRDPANGFRCARD